MMAYPAIGSEAEELHVRTYSEFHMTNDSDLFRFDGVGWPLLQGKTVHHFNAAFNPVEKWVTQAEGEGRLATRWRMEARELPDRTFRIAWRDIAQPTDTRSLINTVTPRGVFCGNKLGLADVMFDGERSADPVLISGVNVMLSSFCADMYVRLRIAKSVSPFIFKSIPMPRDIEVIRQLGELALPLYLGEDFEAFRGDVEPLEDEAKRLKLIAKLDARVAHLYGFTYEEYQAVLNTFPLVEDEQKARCLRAYNDWTFDL